jgi:hypothetical protein
LRQQIPNKQVKPKRGQIGRPTLLEIPPGCQDQLADARVAVSCPASHLNLPAGGQHIRAWGAYVADLDHGGWHEIHPVEGWEQLL